MIARTVARSKLVGLVKNSVVFHILSAAATEDADQYFQMTRLREVFSIDSATGSDLDARAAEISPGTILRRTALYASTTVIFSRPGTTGTITIPSGTAVAAEDTDGDIRFVTAASVQILNGNTSSAAVLVVAQEAGIRSNVSNGTIIKIVDRVAGVSTVTNPALVSNGRDRESDRDFRGRLKNYVQALSRGTPTSIETFARDVQLSDGSRVVFATLYEPAIPNGITQLYLDDGTGSLDEYDSTYLTTADVVVSSAAGGEIDLYTTENAIRDDGSFVVKKNGSTLTRNLDYYLNPSDGHIQLVVALTAGQTLTALYRHYVGLVQEVQRVTDGVRNDAQNYPGVRAGGAQVKALPATRVLQAVGAQIAVLNGYDTTTVSANVTAAIQEYINSLDIGEDVVVAVIIERSMAVDGMADFTLSAPTANQVILPNQVARILSASIVLV